MREPLPLIVEPEALLQCLHHPDVLLVDLCKPEHYARGHIPGAVHLDYGCLVEARPPVGGLLPEQRHLSAVLSSIGLNSRRHVVAYDEEGGGRAGRLLWTLDVLGHAGASMLNGGFEAWAKEGHELSTEPVPAAPGDFVAGPGRDCFADTKFILERLGAADLALLDTRSPAEFSGERCLAARGGHIPGAVNLNWVLAMDPARNLRLKPEAELRDMLERLGVTPDKEVVVYCQTHHRSSHTYVTLKSLGYERLRGYAGAWSEWGNLPDTPVER
jgi:thiosulfate/3-mercaptopyruvate sulfurtransferase